jgi:hypothetical protein
MREQNKKESALYSKMFSKPSAPSQPANQAEAPQPYAAAEGEGEGEA